MEVAISNRVSGPPHGRLGMKSESILGQLQYRSQFTSSWQAPGGLRDSYSWVGTELHRAGTPFPNRVTLDALARAVSPLLLLKPNLLGCKVFLSGLVMICCKLWIQVLSSRNFSRGRAWAGEGTEILLLTRGFILYNQSTVSIRSHLHWGKKGRLLDDDHQEA